MYIYSYDFVITKTLLANYVFFRNNSELVTLVPKITHTEIITIDRACSGASCVHSDITCGHSGVFWGSPEVTWGLLEVTSDIPAVLWGLPEVPWGSQEVSLGSP